jgi:hypothetical protein
MQVPDLVLKMCIGLGGGQGPAQGAAAAFHPCARGVLAYTAGCHAVLLDVANKQQLRHFRPRRGSNRQQPLPLNCLAFKHDGLHLAAGELSSDHASAPPPEICVWEVTTGRVVQQLKLHKHGVGCLAFSADGACSQHVHTGGNKFTPTHGKSSMHVTKGHHDECASMFSWNALNPCFVAPSLRAPMWRKRRPAAAVSGCGLRWAAGAVGLAGRQRGEPRGDADGGAVGGLH